MILFARTELERYYSCVCVEKSERFITVKYGWHSVALLIEPTDPPWSSSRAEAVRIAEAMLLLDE